MHTPKMKLRIKSHPIDLELCRLLGEQTLDFVVLCFDGVQFHAYGTPLDSPESRRRMQSLADTINNRDEQSVWRGMWNAWRQQICRQFNLPPTTTADEYRPRVTCEISRVCPGYSEHLHVAIGLFAAVADRIDRWEISQNLTCYVMVRDKQGCTYMNVGDNMALVISKTVLELLQHQKA